jgi:hypothetical protein
MVESEQNNYESSEAQIEATTKAADEPTPFVEEKPSFHLNSFAPAAAKAAAREKIEMMPSPETPPPIILT